MNDSIILWSKERTLTYDDFKDTLVDSSKYGYMAGLNSQIFIRPEEVYEDELSKVRFISVARPYDSYMFLKRKELLHHEQGHFNITEYNARLMRKELQLIIETCEADCLNKIAFLYEQGITRLLEMQIKYDEETNHGQIEDKQLFWDNWIVEHLKETEEYAREYTIEDLEE